jgi:hypothetical protein
MVKYDQSLQIPQTKKFDFKDFHRYAQYRIQNHYNQLSDEAGTIFRSFSNVWIDRINQSNNSVPSGHRWTQIQ